MGDKRKKYNSSNKNDKNNQSEHFNFMKNPKNLFEEIENYINIKNIEINK